MNMWNYALTMCTLARLTEGTKGDKKPPNGWDIFGWVLFGVSMIVALVLIMSAIKNI